MAAIIKEVLLGSIAQECGLDAGDILTSINGVQIADILDYKFHSAAPFCEIEIKKRDGSVLIVEIENEDYEDLGIIFENPLIDEARRCHNKCIFCFIDQLPESMRKTMYFKDDDYRLSSFLGNYITLTNVTDAEIDKIIQMHLPRINVSVHTTNEALRCHMLNNKNAGKLFDRLKKMAKAGISLNAQIVLCRDVNDKKELDRTILDLSSLYPSLKSISVVPVGLTKYRDNLPKLQKFDTITSKQVIEQIEGWQEKFLKMHGTRLVFASDEFYVSTNTPLPSYEAYESFLQIENGVGLVRELIDDFEDAASKLTLPEKITPKSVVTGVLAYNIIMTMTEKIDKNISVYPIINDFFGHDITVAGLVTGKDLIRQLRGKALGEYLLIPDLMLRDETFLDDITVADVEAALNIKVKIVENRGDAFLQNLLL